jgi:hypothetical protein
MPVKFEMLNAFTLGDPFSGGMKTSKESAPIGIGAAWPADAVSKAPR